MMSLKEERKNISKSISYDKPKMVDITMNTGERAKVLEHEYSKLKEAISENNPKKARSHACNILVSSPKLSEKNNKSHGKNFNELIASIKATAREDLKRK